MSYSICILINSSVKFQLKLSSAPPYDFPRHLCVMPPWLFTVYMDGVVREVNVRMLGKWLDPNQKNIYGAALALIAIMYGIMQGIIAVASLLATMALYGNGRDPQ